MNLDFKQLGSLFALSRDAVLGLEGENIAFCNPAAENMLGLSPGSSAKDWLPPELWAGGDGRYVSSLSLPEGSADITLLREGDRALVTLCRRDPLPGHPSGSLRVFADHLATARMALDALLSRLATEAPAACGSYSAILYRQQYNLQRLCSHLSLMENLRSGSQPMALRNTDLEELFRELCDSVRVIAGEKLGCQLHFKAEPGLYVSAADPELLELMLLNLLNNSFLHGDCREIRVELQIQGERFILCVDDNGCGIAGETLPQLFDGTPALKDAAGGAGLGLSIARGIAELHGGRLILESRPGEGCSVRIVLPKSGGNALDLHMPHPRYGNDGLHRLLTELSPILPDEAFGPKFQD